MRSSLTEPPQSHSRPLPVVNYNHLQFTVIFLGARLHGARATPREFNVDESATPDTEQRKEKQQEKIKKRKNRLPVEQIIIVPLNR